MTSTSATRERRPRGVASGPRAATRQLGLVIALGLVGVLALALPVVALVGRSLAPGVLGSLGASTAVRDALVLSIVTTACSLVLTMALGTPLAIVLARRSVPGASIVETLVDLPIVLPPAVAGLALLLLLGRRGLIGPTLAVAGIELPFSTAAVVIAQTFVSAPFFIRATRAGLAAIDRDLEDAARVDGASEGEVLRRVTLPLAAASIGGGIVMAWARALGEFGATIMFAGSVAGRTQTLPLVVYGEFQAGDLDASIAAASILVVAAFAVLVTVRSLGARRVLDLPSAS